MNKETKIASIIKARKVNVSHLSRKSKVSRSQLYRIINGTCSPSIDTLNAIATALKLEITDII